MIVEQEKDRTSKIISGIVSTIAVSILAFLWLTAMLNPQPGLEVTQLEVWIFAIIFAVIIGGLLLFVILAVLQHPSPVASEESKP